MNPALMKNAIDHEPQKLNPEYEVKILWRNAIFFAITNCILIRYVWFWLIETSWTIHFYVWLMLPLYAAGVTCGAHRLWAHRAYKGNTPYRFLMMILQTMGSQGHIYGWVRNHRLHHKYTDTDADPHNSTRGFFFCHMGWLMVAKHPEVLRKGKSIDMSDLERDWIVMWQKKYASILMPLIAFFIPTLIPMYLGNLSLKDAFGICIGLWQTVLHATWSVNSAAHMWGNKPYDSSVSAVQNVFVSLVAHGEGWHNYHHAFPQDYKAAEIPYFVNVSTAVIDFFSIFGWTYDLTTTKPEFSRPWTLAPPCLPMSRSWKIIRFTLNMIATSSEFGAGMTLTCPKNIGNMLRHSIPRNFKNIKPHRIEGIKSIPILKPWE